MRAYWLLRSLCDVRAKLVLSLALVGGVAGCSAESTPVQLPPGTTFEVYTIVAAEGANTTESIDPATGEAIFLQAPPIITTADIATVARSTHERGAANGQNVEEPALAIELTAGGAVKMSAATASANRESVAVVINGQVIATPKIMSPIRNSFEISGDAPVTAAIEALTKP